MTWLDFALPHSCRALPSSHSSNLIETPYRNTAMLEALANTCNGSALICVATDLTLASESIQTKTASEWKKIISANKTPDFHKKPTVFLFLA